MCFVSFQKVHQSPRNRRYDMDFGPQQESRNEMRKHVEEEELNRVGIDAGNGDSIIELMMLLMDPLVEEILVQSPVCHVVQKVLHKHQEVILGDHLGAS